MGKEFWQKIKDYKLFIVFIGVIIFLIIIKLNSKTKTTTVVDVVRQTTEVENNTININSFTTVDTFIPTIKERTDEEISNLSEDDYFKYVDTLTEEEQKNLPPLAFYVNEAFPHEEDSFLAEKFENLKVYAKAKIDDKAKAERDLKYWFYIEIGATLPSDKIVWE